MPPFFNRIYHSIAFNIVYKTVVKKVPFGNFCSIMEILNIIYPLKMGINHKNNLFKHISKILCVCSPLCREAPNLFKIGFTVRESQTSHNLIYVISYRQVLI